MKKKLFFLIALIFFSVDYAMAQTNTVDYGNEVQIIDDTENNAWVKIVPNEYDGGATVYAYNKTDYPTRESVENANMDSSVQAAEYDEAGNLKTVILSQGLSTWSLSSGQWCTTGLHGAGSND